METLHVNSIEFNGVIWKVLPDDKGDFLIIESRDGEKRKVILSVLDFSTSTLLYTLENLPKPWWIGLKAIGQGKIILQGYKDTKTPEPKGVYVLEQNTGILLWKEEGKTVHAFGSDNELILSSLVEADIVLECVNLSTGKFIRTFVESDISAKPALDSEWHYPMLYLEESIHYKTIATFINDSLSFIAIGAIEYLEYKSYILLSFYTQQNIKFVNHLIVLNAEGECIWKDTLIENSEGVGMSTFFICKDQLIYIKNKNSLAVVGLI